MRKKSALIKLAVGFLVCAIIFLGGTIIDNGRPFIGIVTGILCLLICIACFVAYLLLAVDK